MIPGDREQLRDKLIHILGMARSGMASAEACRILGARVVVHDAKPAEELADRLAELERLGCEWRVGEVAYSGIGSADLVVTSPGVPERCEGLREARRAGVEVIPEIELAYLISAAPILAITGTNGKTTTTALLGAILRSDGRGTYIAGNIAAGDIRLPLVSAALNAREDEAIVAEISSFQLETITAFRPRVAALLNVTSDHLDRHPDIETYARMKARLFEYQTAADVAVVNADDPVAAGIAGGIPAGIQWFSRRCEVEAGTFARGREVWRRSAAGDQMVCDTSHMMLRGRHNVENVLAASAMALSFGCRRESIEPAVNAFRPLEHRMEPVAVVDGVEYINNSMCTNVAAAVSSLDAMETPVVVIAGGKDKGSDYTALGEAFVRRARHVALIGQDAPLIESAALAAGYTAISRAASMAEAVEIARSKAVSGDTVMLAPACASFGMFRDFEERGRVFKDLVNDLARRAGG